MPDKAEQETTDPGQYGWGLAWSAFAILLIAGIGWFYYQAIDTELLGFTHDDGVYAITGKALASGQGFTLLHVVGEPAQVKYPFLYPLFLSLVWLFQPNFPENIILLNLISVIFAMGACWLIFTYLKNYQGFPPWLALIVLALVASNFFFIYFSSTVMAEAPYLFFVMLTLWYWQRQSSREAPLSNRSLFWLLLLSVLAFMTRTLGITLMGAIGVWLLLNRQWKNAFVYGAGSFLLGIAPWFLWTKTQTPKVTDLNFPLVNPYSNYGLELLHNYKAGTYLADLGTNFTSLMQRLLEDMFPFVPHFFKIYPQLADLPYAPDIKAIVATLATYLLAGYFVLQLIHTLRQALQNKSPNKKLGFSWNPQVFTVPGLYLAFYLIVITLWNYEDQMARFLIVMTPLLWMFFFKPLLPALSIGGAFRGNRKSLAVLALILALSLLAIWPIRNSYHIVRKSRSQHWVESGDYRWMWGDYKDAFAWIKRSLPQDAKLAVASDVVFYLYTNRQTFYLFLASLRRANGFYLPESYPLLMKSLDHYGVNYMVVEPHMEVRVVRHPMNRIAETLLNLYPERFKHVYASPNYAIQIFEILPVTKS